MASLIFHRHLAENSLQHTALGTYVISLLSLEGASKFGDCKAVTG